MRFNKINLAVRQAVGDGLDLGGGMSTSVEADIIANHIDPLLSDEEKGITDDDAAKAAAAEAEAAAGDQSSDNTTGEAGKDQSGDQQTQTGEQTGTIDTQTQQQQDVDTSQQQQQAPITVRGDDKGNLVDETGKVIARAGAERRLYEKADKFEKAASQQQQIINNMQQIHQRSANEIQALQAKLDDGTFLAGLPKQYNLSNDDVSMGMRLMANYKNDPVATLKYILTEVQAMGHNLDGIVDNNMNMNAISSMINQKIDPLLKNHENDTARVQADADIQKDVDTFFGRHGDAVVHEQPIARLLEADPSLSMDAAYYKLQAYAVQSGLDWTQPLAPQIIAKQQSATVTNQQQQNRQQDDVPFGVKTNTDPNTNSTPAIADVDTSYDDIIRQSLAESR